MLLTVPQVGELLEEVEVSYKSWIRCTGAPVDEEGRETIGWLVVDKRVEENRCQQCVRDR